MLLVMHDYHLQHYNRATTRPRYFTATNGLPIRKRRAGDAAVTGGTRLNRVLANWIQSQGGN